MSINDKQKPHLKNNKNINERAAAMAVLSASGLAYELLPTTDQTLLEFDEIIAD